MQLCINIDHIATLREARGGVEPSILEAADICMNQEVSGITIHLREDRRHTQDHDLVSLRERVNTFLNLEMAATDEMVAIALRYRPDQVTLVPEKREELTTEGGLDVARQIDHVGRAVSKLQEVGIPVSLFIAPDPEQILAASRVQAELIELHTGCYANASGEKQREELWLLARESEHAQSLGITVNSGHGLDYRNVKPVAAIRNMHELNIGHSIIARAVMVGLGKAVSEMKDLAEQGAAEGPLQI